MPTPPAPRSAPALALALLTGLASAAGLAGCGHEIGDACVIATDCSPNGDRQCDRASAGGYCTVQGCDYNTCPDEAVCVRFFTGSFENRPCDPDTEDAGTDDCSLDELCSLAGHCVARSSEVRYCMRKCDSSGDCRDEYECRTEALMKAHGGEPVLDPERTDSIALPSFCATVP